MSRPRLLVGRAVLVAASVIVALLLCEGYLRLTETRIVGDGEGLSGVIESDPEKLIRYTSRGRRLIPGSRVVIENHQLSGNSVRIRVDSNGFRGPEIPSEKAADEFRILVLGDSITFAAYLHEKDTYPRILERRLRKATGSDAIRVINAGVGDIGLSEELDILVEQGLAVDPDLVILAFYLNDSRPPWGFPAELGARGWWRRNSLLVEKLYAGLKLQQWIRAKGEHRFAWIAALDRLRWFEDRGDFLELASLAKYDWGAAWEENSWPTVARRLEYLKELSLEHDFGVVVAVFPVAYQFHAAFLEDSPQRRMESLAARAGFAYLDLLPEARRHRAVDFYYDQCHPRAVGNQIFGTAIAEYLVSEKLLARERSSPQP